MDTVKELQEARTSGVLLTPDQAATYRQKGLEASLLSCQNPKNSEVTWTLDAHVELFDDALRRDGEHDYPNNNPIKLHPDYRIVDMDTGDNDYE